MLAGKSPTTTCFPAGRSRHWFGSNTAPSACGPGTSAFVFSGGGAAVRGASANAAMEETRIAGRIRFIAALVAGRCQRGKISERHSALDVWR